MARFGIFDELLVGN